MDRVLEVDHFSDVDASLLAKQVKWRPVFFPFVNQTNEKIASFASLLVSGSALFWGSRDGRVSL